MEHQDIRYEQGGHWALSRGSVAGRELVRVFDRRREDALEWRAEQFSVLLLAVIAAGDEGDITDQGLERVSC